MSAVLQKPELILLLKTELAKIENLCALYDLGSIDVILNIAKSIQIIFHNTDLEKSLSTQLKLNHLQILSGTETYNPRSLTNYLGLLKLEHHKGEGWNYRARLAILELKPVSLENWWQNKKIIIDSSGKAFTRSKIIHLVVQDDDIDLGLTKIDTSGWNLKDSKGIKVVIDPIPETIRQIAFELLETFKAVNINKESKLHYKEKRLN